MLSLPWVYDLWRSLVAGNRVSAAFADRYLEVRPGDAVLDIGCGTASVLAVLGDGIEYTGFDRSREYVEAARRRFGARGTFLHATVDSRPPTPRGHFDLAIALGVVHHLDDDEALALFVHAREALKPEGRLVTLDGVYDDRQSRLARWMVSLDRGRNVRDRRGYEALARRHFPMVESEIRYDLLWLPYTHIIMTCGQSGSLEAGREEPRRRATAEG